MRSRRIKVSRYFPLQSDWRGRPGSNDEILEFACTRLKAEFPTFDKVEVGGDNAGPVYKFLKSRRAAVLGDSIEWNSAKFLIDEGHVVGYYAPRTSPIKFANTQLQLSTKTREIQCGFWMLICRTISRSCIPCPCRATTKLVWSYAVVFCCRLNECRCCCCINSV